MRQLPVVLLAALLLLAAPSKAQQQAPFCLVSEIGQQSCFYYSLQGCRQAAATLGGMCAANGQATAPQTQPQPAAATFQQASPLDAMNHVIQAGEEGWRRGEQQREARLRAELLEAQMDRERAAAAAATEQRSVTDGMYLYKCRLANGSVVYTGQPAAGCTVVAAVGATQPTQPYTLQPPAPSPQARYFHGYTCTQDCSGHEAGYEWAEEEGIEDDEDCTGSTSPRF